jgi:hypothetical protein
MTLVIIHARDGVFRGKRLISPHDDADGHNTEWLLELIEEFQATSITEEGIHLPRLSVVIDKIGKRGKGRVFPNPIAGPLVHELDDVVHCIEVFKGGHDRGCRIRDYFEPAV